MHGDSKRDFAYVADIDVGCRRRISSLAGAHHIVSINDDDAKSKRSGNAEEIISRAVLALYKALVLANKCYLSIK